MRINRAFQVRRFVKTGAMALRLVHDEWIKEFSSAIASNTDALRIICPFIKLSAIRRLLKSHSPKLIQVITRFNLCDFADGVSDLSALQWLLDRGARIRGVRNLHSKLYLFGDYRMIVTSANLSEAALARNHEIGFVADDGGLFQGGLQYFDNLWHRSGSDLQRRQCETWEETIRSHLLLGAPPADSGHLGDEGVDVGLPAAPTSIELSMSDDSRAFVKFFGVSSDRALRSMEVVQELHGSGSHWACTYPYGKRPRRIPDGSIMFIGRLVKDPGDIMIYGHATATHHEPGRDDATPDDIRRRPWKEKWPHYIRVHHATFIAGTLGNGISLNRLMESLGSHAFASTQRNLAMGHSAIDPRKSYMQKPDVELSRQGLEWLVEHLNGAYARHGKLPATTLGVLDWPEVQANTEPI